MITLGLLYYVCQQLKYLLNQEHKQATSQNWSEQLANIHVTLALNRDLQNHQLAFGIEQVQLPALRKCSSQANPDRGLQMSDNTILQNVKHRCHGNLSQYSEDSQDFTTWRVLLLLRLRTNLFCFRINISQRKANLSQLSPACDKNV